MLGIPTVYRLLGKPVPYYAHYPLWLIVWKPIRKYINVVIIPNCPFTSLRIWMYRWLGFKIGKRCFIGMKCYMDDLEPQNTTIGDGVTISYGTYFATHGKAQAHTTIRIEDNVYIGMRCNFLSGRDGIVIGRNTIIGACSMVNKSLPPNSIAYGIPCRRVRENTEEVRNDLPPPGFRYGDSSAPNAAEPSE